MSYLVDKKYLSFITSRLEGFKWERANLGRCRCPKCGDSAKKEKKRRFYFYQNTRPGANSDKISCFCHNCNYASDFAWFLKDFDSFQYGQYSMEVFQENSQWRKFIDSKPKEPKAAAKPLFPLTEAESKVWHSPPCSVPVASLPADHYARRYVEGRQISQLDLLWFTDDFHAVVDEFLGEESSKKVRRGEPRLVIPFFNEKKEMDVFQGRVFDRKDVPEELHSRMSDDDIRYLTYKKNDGVSKIFGLERVNKERTVVVLEGPIDSLFVPNCVATAGSDLLAVDWGDLYIPDAQYRNEQICKIIDKIIDKGKKVVLFPEDQKWKDINDLIVKGGMTRMEVLQLIANNTYQGLAAKNRFGQLKKI